MARPVRRSQRGKRQTYQVGDVVEIVRGDGVAPGQLLHKMENAKSSNSDPFWLVAFDDGTRDEEICEKSFGPLLQSGSGVSTTSNVGGRGGGRRGRNKTTGATVDKFNSSDDTSGGGSAANSEEDRESTAANDGGVGGQRKRGRVGDVGGRTKKRRHRPGGSGGASNDSESAGDKMATKESDDAAARQGEGDADADAGSNVADDYDDDSGVNTRSRRRNKTGSPLGGGLDYKAGRNKKGRNHRKGGKRRHQFHQQLYYRRQREWEHDPNETVEKVKFLTGTLFLYRGENPRAVFVRSS